MPGGESISEMNRVADKNRNALNSHDKRRTGKFFKSKKGKMDMVRNKERIAILFPIFTLIISLTLSAFAYVMIKNYMEYEKSITPTAKDKEILDQNNFDFLMESARANMPPRYRANPSAW